jgi:uncharacterized protein (TIGR03435 family)
MRRNSFHLADFSRVLFLLLTCFGFAAVADFAQDSPQQRQAMAAAKNSDPVRAFAFEVVSIRPSNPRARNRQIGMSPNGDEFHVLGFPLGNTILFAYFPIALQRRERLSGAPDWIWKDGFDFVAKIAPENIAAWHQSLRSGFGEPNPMLESMLQAALADRCKLLVHRIPTTVPGYALVIASRGPYPKRFSPAKSDEIIPDTAIKIAEDGRMVPILSPDDPVLHFYATSTTSLAAFLSRSGAPVKDRTGLSGKYDFALTRLSDVSDPSVDLDVTALGLKLKPIRIPADDIVIDHIEYPSPN